MGVGAFFGHRSSNFDTNNAKLYGVELDSVSGRIAQQLYQKAKIQICGYEKADLPDSFFDLAIGNVPFGQYQVNETFDIKYIFLCKITDTFLHKSMSSVYIKYSVEKPPINQASFVRITICAPMTQSGSKSSLAL